MINVELRDKPFHYIQVDGLYTQEEKDFYLDILSKNLISFNSADGSNSGYDKQRGILLKQNKSLFDSDLNEEDRIKLEDLNKRPKEIISNENIQKDSWFFKNIDINRLSVLYSHYDENEYYKSHSDSSKITSISWIYKEPKGFTGGDLIFTEYDITIPCDNNTTIIFPGNIKHEVTKVSLIDKENVGKGFGRFSVTGFWVNGGG